MIYSGHFRLLKGTSNSTKGIFIILFPLTFVIMQVWVMLAQKHHNVSWELIAGLSWNIWCIFPNSYFYLMLKVTPWPFFLAPPSGRVVPIQIPVMENAADTTKNADVSMDKSASLCTNQIPCNVWAAKRSPATFQLHIWNQFFFTVLKQYSRSLLCCHRQLLFFRATEKKGES